MFVVPQFITALASNTSVPIYCFLPLWWKTHRYLFCYLINNFHFTYRFLNINIEALTIIFIELFCNSPGPVLTPTVIANKTMI